MDYGDAGARGSSLAAKMSMAPGKKMSDNRVIINVGGVRYDTYKTTLKNIPDTRLSWITETTAHNPDYDPLSGEYFFDRHPGVFNMILNYYRTGKLHAPIDVCGPLFEEELAFWGIDEKQIEACCWPTYRAHRDAQDTLAEFDGDEDDDSDEDNIAERFGIAEATGPNKTFWERWQPPIWKLVEEPSSSTAAQVVAVVSVTFVLLSIISFCMETQSPYREYINESQQYNASWNVLEKAIITKPKTPFNVIEIICIVYFTMELLVRFTLCPSKITYMKITLNWIDFFSILPFYIRTIIIYSNPSLESNLGLYFFNALRLIRIFRILKLARHVSGLKILGHTIKASAHELMFLILVLGIGILIFGSLIYYAEQIDENEVNDFIDIPMGFWWAIVTMTTLGYGDMHPRSGVGYAVGAICSVCGVLMIALPVPVIVNNFTLYYSHAQAKQKLPKKTRKILVGAADALKNQMGELDEEEGSPHASVASLKSNDRKESLNSAHGSTDSGIKTASGSGDSFGISVIYTDEIAQSPPPRKKSPPCVPTPTAHRNSVKKTAATNRRNSIMPHAAGMSDTSRRVSSNSMTRKPPTQPKSRRRSLLPT